MRIVNPYDDDSRFDEIRRKWGQPKIIEPRNHEWRYQCAACGAGWIGPTGDYCDWCYQRWLLNRESNRKRILFPEWLNWGERYWSLSPIDKQVWERTRGFVGDYRGKWQRDLAHAVTGGLVIGIEASQSTKRYLAWMIHLRNYGK